MKSIIKKHPYLLGWGIDIIVCIAVMLYVTTHEPPQSMIMTLFIIALGYISLAGIILVPIIIAVCKSESAKRDRLRIEKEKTEYREKYISELSYSDTFFGRLTFEYDSNKNMFSLISGLNNVSFGRHDEYTAVVDVVGDSSVLSEALKHLAEAFRNADTLLDELCREAKEYCDDWSESDKYGNSLTLDYIREHISLSDVIADKCEGSDDIIISLTAYVLSDIKGEGCLLGEHIIIYTVNCKTGEKSCCLEG